MHISLPERETDLQTLCCLADEALYCAKAEGRNRVRAYELLEENTDPSLTQSNPEQFNGSV
ncbi:MAG: hypothetical protein RBJ76_15930 [Stenomitos frigidus ULC029]